MQHSRLFSSVLAVLSLQAIIVASSAAQGDFFTSQKQGEDKGQDTLLSCDKKVDILLQSWGKTLFCVNQTEYTLQTLANGAVLSASELRSVCGTCKGFFEESVILYGNLNQRCDLNDFSSKLKNFFATLYYSTRKYPCFVTRDNCTTVNANGFCQNNAVWENAGLSVPGRQGERMCNLAIETSCEMNPSQPYCYCSGGLCHLKVTSDLDVEYMDVSVYEMMCDRTGIVANLLDMGRDVDIIDADDNSKVLVRLSQAWKNPPLLWQENNCSSPDASVTLFGDMRRCTKGFSCPVADGHIERMSFCEPGYYCPDSAGPSIKCPTGYYCPAGMWKPVKCQILSVCPEGAMVDTPFNGVIMAIIFLIIVLVAYRIVKSREEIAWVRMSEGTRQY